MKTPARYIDAKYEDVPQVIRDLFEKVKDTRRGMYIHGPVGSGKTHIAYALANHAITDMRLFNTRFWNVTQLLHTLRADFDKPWTEKARIDEDLLEDRGLLFLDDIGSEKMSDWVAETFYLILNWRYNENLPTIFTSNLPIAELAERVGDRTASRIVEMCDVVELGGEDRRLTKTNKINA